MTLAKICGLTTPQVIDACVQAQADFIGFVAYPKSPRHLSPQKYASLALRADDIPTVLVTVNATDHMLDEYIDMHRPTYVQFHGNESPARLSEIRSRNVKIIKALGIAEVGDLQKISEFKDSADILLLDAKPLVGELPGGNAKSFDWSLLAQADLPENWMLSGGLTPDNIAQAIEKTGAPMVDISSGVEVEAGVKDVSLIKDFIENAKN